MLKLLTMCTVHTPSISFCCLGSRFKGSLALGILGIRMKSHLVIGGECDIRKGIRSPDSWICISITSHALTQPCAIMHRHSPNADLSYCMILSVLCDLQQGNRKNLVCHLAVAPTHDSSFTKAAGRFFSISLTNVCAKCQAHMRDID